MTKLFLALLLMIPVSAHAVLKNAPFMPESDSRFNDLEKNLGMGYGATSGNSVVYAAPGIHSVQMAVATYDFTKQGGTVADHVLGVYLPANAVVIRSFSVIEKPEVSAGGGKIALNCLTAGDLSTAKGYVQSGPGNIPGSAYEGVQTGASTVFLFVNNASCQLTATISVAAVTAGKINYYVEYVVNPIP